MLFRSAARAALALGHRQGLSVVLFHRVLRERDPLYAGEISAEDFRARMRLLSACFNVVDLEVGLDLLRSGDLPPGSVAITFDDGYADNLHVAAPILRELGLTATFFISTGAIRDGIMWNDVITERLRETPVDAPDLSFAGLPRSELGNMQDRVACRTRLLQRAKHLSLAERKDFLAALADALRSEAAPRLMMTPDELRSLEGMGMRIGGHTVNHPILSVEEDRVARAEMQDSLSDLQGWLGHEVSGFAYPNGKAIKDFDERHVAVLRDRGLRFACTTEPGVATAKTDPLLVPRFTPWRQRDWAWVVAMLGNHARGRNSAALKPAATAA